MEKIKVIKEPTKDKPFLIIDKPSGLPTAPKSKEDENNALFQAVQLFPEILNVHGRNDFEHGLLHRIDVVTQGLVMIATTQDSYDYLIDLQLNNKIIKTYKASCILDYENTKNLQGFPSAPKINYDLQKTFTAKSLFRHYGPGSKEVRPVTKDSGRAALESVGKKKEYTTKVNIVSIKNNIYTVECEITNGFKHQVRCHLAWNNLPIINDPVYNFKNKNTENTIEFSAFKLNINGDIYTRKET